MARHELLAPAGDFPSLIAAIEAGADAIYFGLKDFNMRLIGAKNFSLKDLARITKLCAKGKDGKPVKRYLTLNIIIYDEELTKLEKLFKKIRGKVDAVICWDLSVINLCKKYKIPFHVSTQASISNSKAAEFYKELGAERIVLARELNLKQVRKISKIVDIECFIHGAMCVSISGRCFISQFLAGKSANRGECLQYCRRAYTVKDQMGNELKLENNHVMSAKDLCTLDFIEQLKMAGIKSFKIEGRARSPDYVKTVVSVYRKALDKKLTREEIAEGMEKLESVFNRGFSSGFYLGRPTEKDFASSEKQSNSREKKLPLGRIVKYWPKIQVAAIKLQAGNLSVGDEIYIIGKVTGIERVKVERMEANRKLIARAAKGQTIGLKTPRCREGDEVFIIKKRLRMGKS